jgi:hypothetical protein
MYAFVLMTLTYLAASLEGDRSFTRTRKRARFESTGYWKASYLLSTLVNNQTPLRRTHLHACAVSLLGLRGKQLRPVKILPVQWVQVDDPKQLAGSAQFGRF